MATDDTCAPDFYCAASERNIAHESFPKYYVKPQGNCPGIYTRLDIVNSGPSDIYPTKADSLAEALTKWKDICIACHHHNGASNAQTPPTSPFKRGPRLDSSFVSTPTIPFSPTRKAQRPNMFISPTPSRASSPSKGLSHGHSSSTASTSLKRPYFLLDSGVSRAVYMSGAMAFKELEQSGGNGKVVTCWDRTEAQAFLSGEDSDDGLS